MDITYYTAYALVIFLGIGLHEYAHCKMADLSGDPTARMMGRVTLDLTKHFELTGTLMIIFTTITGFGIGWGKPAPVNPSKLKNPRWDHFMVVAAGPLSNILQAGIYAIVFRLIVLINPSLFLSLPVAYTFLSLGVIVNLALAFFNLIPLGLLDGHWLLGLLLPEPARTSWFQFNRKVGAYMFLILILGDQLLRSATGFSIIGNLIAQPAFNLASFFLGQKM